MPAVRGWQRPWVRSSALRRADRGGEEVLTIEGNASDVVITSEVTNLRRVFDVQGITAFNITWKPVKSC